MRNNCSRCFEGGRRWTRVHRPERGYWAKQAVGKAPHRPALPEPGAGTQLYWSRTSDQIASFRPKAPSPRQPKPRVQIPRDRIHPLIIGASAHFEKGRAVDDGCYLKPYKKMLVDITAAKSTLNDAFDLANELFNMLEAAGHHVVLAPTHLQLRRAIAEEREPVGKPRQYWEQAGLWSPDRATVVFVGTVAIGLQIVEMSESVTLRYVRGKYIRDADYIATRRGFHDDSFTTTRAMPSGRLRVIAYSPYAEIDWNAQWQDTAKSAVRSSLRTIVATIADEASRLVDKLAEAERQRQIRHQEWLVQENLRQRENDRRKIAESVTDSTTALRKVIDHWADRTNIERFLDGVEQRAASLPDEDKKAVLERLALARAFLENQDPLNHFRSWQTPSERYQPRFPERATVL